VAFFLFSQFLFIQWLFLRAPPHGHSLRRSAVDLVNVDTRFRIKRYFAVFGVVVRLHALDVWGSLRADWTLEFGVARRTPLAIRETFLPAALVLSGGGNLAVDLLCGMLCRFRFTPHVNE